MDLFGETLSNTVDASTFNGKPLKKDCLVEYIGELAPQYRDANGKAIGRIDKIDGNQITLLLAKDNKVHRLKVHAMDVIA